MVGKLERVPLREVWKHEELDFTRWLRDNIEVLNDVVGLSLANVESEQRTSEFRVDLVAEDAAGDPVVIENQLEKSDHEHLGKLITYLTALAGRAAIWIVADPRPEHVGAITWLNESGGADFYLVKVEAVKIGDSEPAPLLTLIVGPSEATREVGETRKDVAERHNLRERFWMELLPKAKERTKLHANISPSTDNWIAARTGKSGLSLLYVIRMHDSQVGLNIDRGKDRDEENKAIFEALAQSRETIESDFGGSLLWDKVEGRRTCTIWKQFSLGGYRDESRWPEIQEAMIDGMVRLEAALRPHIQRLSLAFSPDAGPPEG